MPTDTNLKRHPIEWEKIFASYTTNKGLITRIYRELKNTNPTKNQHSMNKSTN
jgi:hypothetical protein